MQSHRQSQFCADLMYHESDPARRVTRPWNVYMAKFDPGWEGNPIWYVDWATRLGESPHLSCKRDQIKMRYYMDRRFTPPKRVTSPTWGSPPPCKQALSLRNRTAERRGQQNACVWQTWQAYYLRVLWWSSLKLMFPGLLQKVLLKGGWSSAEKSSWQNYCHACHTRFAVFFPLPSCCVSLLIQQIAWLTPFVFCISRLSLGGNDQKMEATAKPLFLSIAWAVTWVSIARCTKLLLKLTPPPNQTRFIQMSLWIHPKQNQTNKSTRTLRTVPQGQQQSQSTRILLACEMKRVNAIIV